MPRIDALLRDARLRLPDGVEADLLLAHVLGCSRTWLFTHAQDELDADTSAAFAALLERRERGEPVAYLTGERGFWRFDLQVGPATLIPRAETELLVELALARLPNVGPMRLADLGTGSGAIALALAFERPHAQVIATDMSGEALAIASSNARALSLHNIAFRQGDWFAALTGARFDLIASNPPYIADDDPHLAEGDLRFEPASALSSGIDGLDAIRLITAQAPAHLLPGGWLLIEHGFDQGAQVQALMRAAGLVGVETVRDLELRDRVTLGHLPR
ncbi:peptide chain release factor N(5)-glutamine methyltransferase [Montanilutibacter psychrotolerans]|uniref:Release factor glutamine methyltransferase n=1 Tax=Montanilutibacter psychrotolerans TaxID=1327343 RepID=A0A3M8SS63_9GAMM|nr:peptide chain release factor N(5)-glutamine methyltransferase [Lysobacter psychrotolerans]RNF84149.1 peptide chain release factor N(5)-glutamine methyltransferase [Lysobacter psychrotolerans]